jgi:hypothetical protein
VRWRLQGFQPKATVEEARMVGPDYMAANRLGKPEEVRVETRRRTWAEVQHASLPPHSVTIWMLSSSAEGGK